MAANIISQNGHVRYGYTEYVVDTVEDLETVLLNASVNIPMGCVALVIDTCDVYILNGKKQWKKLTSNSTSGGNSSGDIDFGDDDVIYDGGTASSDTPTDEIIFDSGNSSTPSDNEIIFDSGGSSQGTTPDTTPDEDIIYDGGII